MHVIRNNSRYPLTEHSPVKPGVPVPRRNGRLAAWIVAMMPAHNLIRRLEAVEARQRAACQHDPGCPAGWTRTDNGWVMARYPQSCECWLASERES